MESGIEKEKILGAGISVPAIVSANRKDIDFVVLADIPRDFHAKITAHIPFPCAICNDSNAGGFAEQWEEPSEGKYDLSLPEQHSGGAVVSGHRIVSGDNQRCGEFGHMLLVPEGAGRATAARRDAWTHTVRPICSLMRRGKSGCVFRASGCRRKGVRSGLGGVFGAPLRSYT